MDMSPGALNALLVFILYTATGLSQVTCESANDELDVITASGDSLS